MATVLITGGTGMIGTALSNLLLNKGYDVIILSRNPSAAEASAKAGPKQKTENPKLSYAIWNPSKLSIDTAAIEKSDYIINLAGTNVGDKRWTAKRKKEILDSRVKSGETLVKALKEIPNKVKAIVQSSGIDWYPADPTIPNKNPFTETIPPGNHFLGEVCQKWESSIQPVTQRLVIFRIGLVVSKTGGAIDRFEKPIRFGITPILSSGQQMISWIHIEDMCRLYLYAMENEQLQGVYNAVSPNPVSNKNLMLELAQLISGRLSLPIHVPAFILKFIFGELGAAILKSNTVSAEKISRAGFQFLFPSIEPALFDIEKK